MDLESHDSHNPSRCCGVNHRCDQCDAGSRRTSTKNPRDGSQVQDSTRPRNSLDSQATRILVPVGIGASASTKALLSPISSRFPGTSFRRPLAAGKAMDTSSEHRSRVRATKCCIPHFNASGRPQVVEQSSA